MISKGAINITQEDNQGIIEQIYEQDSEIEVKPKLNFEQD